MKPYSIRFTNYLYPFTIYDEHGREVYHLMQAIEIAQTKFTNDWTSVSNGLDSVTRQELLACA